MDLDSFGYNKMSEDIVEVLCKKTQSNSPLFYRILVGYNFCKAASMMRTKIRTKDRGDIPINLYAVNLAESGAGKGHSNNIMEDDVMQMFKDRFLSETFPIISEQNIAKMAIKRAIKSGSDEETELERVRKEFDTAGHMLFSFDSATTAAVKQMRHKLLMANSGSMNLEIDEIGSNLLSNSDVLTTILELFDVGKVKQKLTKNTAENTRGEDLDGKTPTNMMLYGTPAKLLDGGKTQEEYLTMLETGFGRRCFFGYNEGVDKNINLSPEEIYETLIDDTSKDCLNNVAVKLAELADPVNFGRAIEISKAVSIELIVYKMACEKIAAAMPSHEDIKKAEVSHRYFKALKLAGAYAFMEGSHEITREHLYSAIKIAEDSGKAFEKMLTRDRNYVKLAKYIAAIGHEVTHVDLVEDLPFYKGGAAQKNELMTLAIAYGYKNNIVITRSMNDGIEFLKGESLKETNLKEMKAAYSTKLADEYLCENIPFDRLHELCNLSGYHWVNHMLVDGYRNEEHVIPGFNMIVLDVDGEIQLTTAQLLLKDYKYLMYTTKRHTEEKNRFRIILPLSHTLELSASEYKEVMDNIYEWLPFAVDTATGQRARKWLTNPGEHYYNEGDLLDALLFMPKTAKNIERKQIINSYQSLNNMERWFLGNTGSGNRSNQLIKYALLLVDSGMSFEHITNNVLSLNNKLDDRLDEKEILNTILVTAGKAMHKRDNEV